MAYNLKNIGIALQTKPFRIGLTAGALYNTPDLIGFSDVQKGNFLAGCAFYSDATTVGYGVFTDNY